MIGQVLDAANTEAENTNCIHSSQVCQSIGGGTGSGMDTREKPLTAASCRCQRVRSESLLAISMHGRG